MFLSRFFDSSLLHMFGGCMGSVELNVIRPGIDQRYAFRKTRRVLVRIFLLRSAYFLSFIRLHRGRDRGFSLPTS